MDLKDSNPRMFLCFSRLLSAAAICAAFAGPANAALLHCVVPGGDRGGPESNAWMATSDFSVRTEKLASVNWRDSAIAGTVATLFAHRDAHLELARPLIEISSGWGPIHYLLTIDERTETATIQERLARPAGEVEFVWSGSCVPEAEM